MNNNARIKQINEAIEKLNEEKEELIAFYGNWEDNEWAVKLVKYLTKFDKKYPCEKYCIAWGKIDNNPLEMQRCVFIPEVIEDGQCIQIANYNVPEEFVFYLDLVDATEDLYQTVVNNLHAIKMKVVK